MKLIVSIFLLVSNLAMFSQTDTVIGEYYLKMETNDGNLFEYELTLNQDGTFSFHYYSNIKRGVPPEVNKYAKGKWNEENNIIAFTSQISDIDEKHTLDFSKSKARFITKSPRNKTSQIIKIKLTYIFEF